MTILYVAIGALVGAVGYAVVNAYLLRRKAEQLGLTKPPTLTISGVGGIEAPGQEKGKGKGVS